MTSSETEAATRVEAFARTVLGRPLWPHQREFSTSPARYRVLLAGRQAGKSTELAIEALFTASTRRNQVVLLVSAGETASRRLLDECAALATGSPLLRGSVLDETRSLLTLSNGSRIISVPASQRQIRGWPVDLLILDEAGFIDPAIWRAAEPAIIARPGSRVILSSSPWGGPEHFFRVLWQRGMDAPDDQVAAWHWPSSISPLVDRVLLEQIRQREPADYFEREYLAQWTDESGAFFTTQELSGAVAPYELLAPERVAHLPGGRESSPVAAGVDWGVARDANALVLAGFRTADDGRWQLFLPWLEAHHGMPWDTFINRICTVAAAYGVRSVASESNGVGAWPSDDLQGRLHRAGHGWVYPVWTDAKRKQSGFGMIKGLLQAGRLVLPAHPEMLRQLRGLEFEQLPAGGLRIAVPERSGHDDLAMATLQALSCCETRMLHDLEPSFERTNPGELVTTGAGVRLPRLPRPHPSYSSYLQAPSGREHGDGW